MKDPQIPESLVRRELSLILDFEEIRNSHILSRFIEFVVEKKLLGQEDEIKEYTIAVKGLGKPPDYNPQMDASVRIHAGRLRRILSQYYRESGKNDNVLIDIPKGSYVPIFTNRNNGHSVVKVLFPAKQQQEVSASTAGIVNMILQKKPVLAVLPFHNLSSDDSKNYIVAGIGEQLSIDIARFQNISVISYFSTSVYGAELKSLQEMKAKVQIDYVLTGSVRFTDETVKMNVQLILTENGEIIFTDSYARYLTPENIFDIQDGIINQVANLLAGDNGFIMNKAHASPFTKAENLNVHESIYKYFDYALDYNNEKFQIAINALESVVQTEPNNALALALLAGLYMDRYIIEVTENNALLTKAAGLAYQAAELDPHSQHAQRSLAWAFLLTGKKEKSFEAIENCIKLNPKASSIIATMALAYICQGDYARGFKWLLETVDLNPTAPGSAKFCFALFYFHNKDYNESLKWHDRIGRLDTPFLRLLKVALCGKIDKTKKEDIDETTLALKDNARNIIERMIFDDKLVKEIINGLQVAGLTVK